MEKVFIDGSAGTTGLGIRERLSSRRDLEIVILPEEFRKDPAARRDAICSSDAAILCLPDDAAREAAALAGEAKTAIIDASTAHRLSPGWEYGFPDLPGRRERIASSRRIANPGCHASGFIALVAPLAAAGVLHRDAVLSCFSLTGYTGGGKKMIAEYEAALGAGAAERDRLIHLGGRQYAFGQSHKHIPEMTAVCGLANPPLFSPIVVPHARGMETTVSLFADDLDCTPGGIREIYDSLYGAGTGVVRHDRNLLDGGTLSSAEFSGRDGMAVAVGGNSERITLVAVFDNLGKGASGAAVQNLNIVLGRPETCGLVL